MRLADGVGQWETFARLPEVDACCVLGCGRFPGNGAKPLWGLSGRAWPEKEAQCASWRRPRDRRMDALYDVVEQVHVFIPLAAIFLIFSILVYYYKTEQSMLTINIAASGIPPEKKED